MKSATEVSAASIFSVKVFKNDSRLESDKTWLHAGLGVWDPPSCILLDNAVDTICGDLPRAPTAGRGAPTTR
jgi:hypothetical protein